MCSITITGTQLQSHLSSSSNTPFLLNNMNMNRIDTNNNLSSKSKDYSNTFSEIYFIGSIMTASSMTESHMIKELHAEVYIYVYVCIYIYI
jgi:hypothetical protein